MANSNLQENAEIFLLRLMQILYNLGILFIGLFMRLASLFNPKARQWVEGRKKLESQFVNTNDKDVLWFHCASLGEFDQGLPLLNKLKEESPESFILLTFFSPSGMNFHHKRNHSADHVMYLPLDTPRKSKAFINHYKPKKVFFIKYEFWFNILQVAKKSGAELYNVSGIFREDHRFFKWYGGFFRNKLKCFDWFFLQNKKSLELLNSIGHKNASITGDSRFDRVIENKKQATSNALIETFKNDEKLLVLGSSWIEEEKIIAPWIKEQDIKVLIAPHNIDSNHIKKIQELFPESIRYTESKNNTISSKKILILDTMGQLANVYTYGDFAFVGGGFSGSLHNILEPAVFGLPVIFGPKHKRFPEAQQFINHGFGFSVSTTSEFATVFNHISHNYTTISNKETKFIEENAGASNKILAFLETTSN